MEPASVLNKRLPCSYPRQSSSGGDAHHDLVFRSAPGSLRDIELNDVARAKQFGETRQAETAIVGEIGLLHRPAELALVQSVSLQ